MQKYSSHNWYLHYVFFFLLLKENTEWKKEYSFILIYLIPIQ